jgi:hypothetical protein
MAKQSDKSSGCTGKRGRGRPRVKAPETYSEAQLRLIDELAEAQCKDTTIAEVLGVDVNTFKGEFLQRTRKKRAEGKAAVMQAQYRGALRTGKSSTTERIWWGKQHLEQTDRADVTSGDHAIVPAVVIVKPEGVD